MSFRSPVGKQKKFGAKRVQFRSGAAASEMSLVLTALSLRQQWANSRNRLSCFQLLSRNNLINRERVHARYSSGAKAHILYPFYVGAEAPTS
jgi:hypothetical protein